MAKNHEKMLCTILPPPPPQSVPSVIFENKFNIYPNIWHREVIEGSLEAY